MSPLHPIRPAHGTGPARQALPSRVLILENSRSFAAMVSDAIGERLGLEVVCCRSLAEAAGALHDDHGVFLVLTGLVVSDGETEQVLDFFLGRGLPTVVVSGAYDEATRDRILSRPVVDCVLKNTPGNIDYLVWLVQRLERNRRISALVVDDSTSARSVTSALLSLYGFKVIEAGSGPEALEALAHDPRIRLATVDHEMPGMDGIELVRRMRATLPRDHLAVVGVSGGRDGGLVARFLKNGANDFLHKPFSREEFFCRISQNIDNLELIGTLQDLATRDFLTGLPNRRHFLDEGGRAFEDHVDAGAPLTLAMLDIDHFKHVNDTWGHDAGDQALKAVAQALQAHARPTDVLGRFGGEEFCLLLPSMGEAQARAHMDALRERIAGLEIPVGEESLSVTVSIGLCPVLYEDLHAMLLHADRALYIAKASGRNRVVVDLDTELEEA
ncbi:MAG: GGDEF domain-containing response regulator [Lysobacteraceae bacterium]